MDGDIKYLSHQDMLRMFTRALVRASFPVRFTQGFNPRPRLSLPLPRPVGVASDAECLVLELTDELPEGELASRLQEQMPAGVRIRAARRLQPTQRYLPTRVQYRVQIERSDVSGLCRNVRDLLATESVVIDRRTGESSPSRRVDIRPFIDRIDIADESLVMVLHVTPHGSVRPSEVLSALGMKDEAILNRVRRIEVQWQ
ncbi:MAG: DUF2344 domain-containing protein [Phycisphaerae bacterium]|nr:DUF2344 domain-containing protein [Phycisphaerae bacterium]